MTTTVVNPFPTFKDVDGTPLDDGYIYIGSSGLNPESNPVTVYWNKGLTTPAAQPIRTINGFPSQSGTPGTIFTSESGYSIIVKNKNGTLVYSKLVNDLSFDDSNNITTVAGMIASKNLVIGDRITTYTYNVDVVQSWEVVAAATGTSDGFLYVNLTGTGLQAKQISIGTEEFYKKAGATGDGTVDDTAFVAAVHASGVYVIGRTTGQYKLTSPLTIPAYQLCDLGEGLTDPSNGATAFGSCAFYIAHGAGDTGVKAITMSHSSMLKGVTIYYPDQVAKSAATPTAYGYSITAAAGVTDNIRLEDITLYNSYFGIELDNAGRFFLNNIQGNPLAVGITADDCFDVCRMSNVHFWNFYTQADTLEDWVQDNLIAYDFYRVDDLQASKCFTWQPNIGLRLNANFWGTFNAFTVDKARVAAIHGNGAAHLQMTNTHLIMDANIRPAVYIDSGNYYQFDNLITSDGTSAVGVQINGGSVVNINNAQIGSTHFPIVVVDTSVDVNINNLTATSGLPPVGYANVKLDGVMLFDTNTALALPAAALVTATEAPAGQFNFDLGSAGVQEVKFETTYILQRCGLYTLRVTYDPPNSFTAYRFKVIIQQDTGTPTQISYAPLSPLVLNGDTATQIHIPLHVNWVKFKQQIKIQVESTDTTGGTGKAVTLTSLSLLEQLDTITTDKQIDMMLDRYHLDGYTKGKTRSVQGGKMILTAEAEGGIGRATAAPSAGASAVGDITYEMAPAAAGKIGLVCTTGGSPGTWKPFGAIDP